MWKKTKPITTPSHPAIERARRVARMLDSTFTIPIIRKKIGIDPLLGVVPVWGDIITTVMALYLLWIAYDLRMPNHVLLRMGINIVADLLIGMVPVVGDISDFFWKSNDRNFKILEAAYEQYGVGIRQEHTGQTTIDIHSEPIGSS